jgi:hypothetical protein
MTRPSLIALPHRLASCIRSCVPAFLSGVPKGSPALPFPGAVAGFTRPFRIPAHIETWGGDGGDQT